MNLLVEPDLYEEYAQSLGGLRKSSGVEMLKSVLSKKQKMFSILYSKSFKNLRNSMQYVISESPVHIASVGDYENVRMSMSENIHLIAGDFDVPKKDSIKAYYYNKDTEKYGKIIMYRFPPRFVRDISGFPVFNFNNGFSSQNSLFFSTFFTDDILKQVVDISKIHLGIQTHSLYKRIFVFFLSCHYKRASDDSALSSPRYIIIFPYFSVSL